MLSPGGSLYHPTCSVYIYLFELCYASQNTNPCRLNFSPYSSSLGLICLVVKNLSGPWLILHLDIFSVILLAKFKALIIGIDKIEYLQE